MTSDLALPQHLGDSVGSTTAPRSNPTLRIILCGFALLAPVMSRAQDITQALPAGAQPMTTSVVPEPMSQLLKEGFDIVSFSAGLGGFGYLLKRDRTWIICTIGLYGEAASPKPYSRCESLVK